MSSLIDKKFSEYLKTLNDQAAAGMLRNVVFSLPKEQRRAVIIQHLPEIKTNDCNKCGYDMGEEYENCGGADDGVCPECGTDEAVHNGHCSEDACKYGDKDCPVVIPKDRVWDVPVLRTGYATKTISVIAATEYEAIEKAIEKAGDEEFRENNAEYSAPYGAF